MKKRGQFFAYDPHAFNPAFWLYRDKHSPFYSKIGITKNERLLTGKEISKVFSRSGFEVETKTISGVPFSYIEGGRAKYFLNVYNFLDKMLGMTPLAKYIGAWLISYGTKK